jgi:hypothetical protein
VIICKVAITFESPNDRAARFERTLTSKDFPGRTNAGNGLMVLDDDRPDLHATVEFLKAVARYGFSFSTKKTGKIVIVPACRIWNVSLTEACDELRAHFTV